MCVYVCVCMCVHVRVHVRACNKRYLHKLSILLPDISVCFVGLAWLIDKAH